MLLCRFIGLCKLGPCIRTEGNLSLIKIKELSRVRTLVVDRYLSLKIGTQPAEPRLVVGEVPWGICIAYLAEADWWIFCCSTYTTAADAMIILRLSRAHMIDPGLLL